MFVENSEYMYIVVAEAKKLAVINYFIAFFCEIFSDIELLKEVSNGCGWITTCSHAIKHSVRSEEVMVLYSV